MTWMVIRLFLSLAFVGGVLWFAARLAKKRGLGGTGNGVIEVLARQRMGRSSTVNLVRIGDTCLVVGATEEHITLLAEVDPETVDAAVRTRPAAQPAPVDAVDDADADADAEDGDRSEPVRPRVAARTSTGALGGSVFDRNGWGSFVSELREKTVRRS